MLHRIKEMLEPENDDNMLQEILETRKVFERMIYSECKVKLKDLKDEMQMYEAGPLKFHQRAIEAAEVDINGRDANDVSKEKIKDEGGVSKGPPVSNRVFDSELRKFTT